jgi:membrane-bound lytic murein transglycosylase A
MIAQDTGSAIVGPARADLYWGAGDDAGRIAGRIRHPGRFVMLLPRELDMTEAGKHMPLPAKKPKIPDTEVKKDGGKSKTRAAKGEAAKTEPVKNETSKSEPAKVEPAKTEPVKTEADGKGSKPPHRQASPTRAPRS